MKNNEKIEDLLKHWMMFRDEELSLLSNYDKKHPLRFEKYEAKLLNSLP